MKSNLIADKDVIDVPTALPEITPFITVDIFAGIPEVWAPEELELFIKIPGFCKLKFAPRLTLVKLLTEPYLTSEPETISIPFEPEFKIDTAVDASLAAGAMGARMVGGGFGGSAIALIKASEVQQTRDAVAAAFELKGFKKPRFFTSLPSAGASAHLAH